ncbi:MAG TPA: cyclic nucleotide-binding domain-containing protein [Polyangiales bacterium]
MKKLVERAFGVRPQEFAIVSAFFAFFVGIGMFYTVGCSVADTLFLSSLTPTRVPAVLPWVYAGVAVANVAAAVAFDALSRRLPRGALLVGIQVLLAISVVIFRELIELPHAALYFVLVIWIELCAIVSITLFYSLAGDYFAPRDARRLYGFIAGGMSLGTVVSGEFVRVAVTYLGTKNLLYLGAALLLVNAAIALHILRVGKPVTYDATEETDAPEHAQLRAIFARPYVRYLALVIPLAIALSVMADYQMKWVASAKTEQALARFFGSFYAWLGFAQIVFQFVLVPRLLHRLGIINCLLILPLALGAASSLLVVGSFRDFFGLPLLSFSAATNFLRLTIFETLDLPSRELLFLPLPPRIRLRAQPLVVGALAPASQGLTGLVLYACFSLGMHVERLSYLVLLLSAVLVLALLRLRPSYRATLAATLREHKLDPTDLERILQSPNVEPVLEELLRSPDTEVVRATLELIKDRELAGLALMLQQLVSSPHESAALGALAVLAERGGPPAIQAIERARQSKSRELQKAAVLALCKVSGADALPRARESLLSHDRTVRNSAIIGLAKHCGEQGITLTRPDLEARAHSKRMAERIEAAQLLGSIGSAGYADLLGPLLDDADPEVRKAACEACAQITDPLLVPVLLAKLDDADLQAGVLAALGNTPPSAAQPLIDRLTDTAAQVKQRSVMARVLACVGGEPCCNVLLHTLSHEEDVVLRTAAAEALCSWKARQSGQLHVADLDALIAGLCDAIELGSRAHAELGAADAFASGAYREHADMHVELLLLTVQVALPADAAQLQRVRWNLFRDPDASGLHAIELLDEILPRRLGPPVVSALQAWLDGRTARGTALSPQTRSRLLHAGPFLRALTMHYLNHAPSGDEPDEPLTMNLAEARIYGLLDVVSFLKRVPIFAELRACTLLEEAEISEWVARQAGEGLFAQGDAGDALYIICDGSVAVLAAGHEVARLGAGQCIGELALLDDEPRSAAAIATTDTRLLRVEGRRFKGLILTQPAVAKAMLRTLDQRIRDTQASVKARVQDDPPMRRSQMFRAQNLGLSELISTMSFLQQIDLFKDLDTPEIANLAGIAQELPMLEGDVLFNEGDVGESLYLVCSGTVAIQIAGREVARFARGGCLGEMALISGLPRSATAAVLESGQLLRIGSDDFTSLLEARPEIAMALLRTLAQRLRRISIAG